MAFPQTSAPAETSFSTASTTHNVSMPGTVNSGDLLVSFVGFISPTTSAVNLSTPSGWTAFYYFQMDVGSATGNMPVGCYLKVADGTEGGGTVNFPTSASTRGCTQVYRVEDWYGSLTGVERSAISFGAGTAPNPGVPSAAAICIGPVPPDINSSA